MTLNDEGRVVVPLAYDGTVPTAMQYQWILDSTVEFDLAFTKHRVLFGLDALYEPSGLNTQNGQRSLNQVFLDVENPEYGNDIGPTSLTTFNGEREWLGFYLQDQISLFDERLHILVGGRFDNVWQRVDFQDPANDFSFNGSQYDSAITFCGGVLYELFDWLHPYFSYSQGFSPTSPFTVGNLDPETSEQFELGLKVPLFEERVLATLSFYQLDKNNVAVDFDNDGVFNNGGAFRSRGLEFDLTGEILPGLNAIVTYAYTDTEVLSSDFIQSGNRFVGVPLNSGSIALTYSFSPDTGLDGLTIGSNLYVSQDRAGDTDNNFSVPGFELWGAFARYRREIGPTALVTQINFNNILNQRYIQSVSGAGNLYPGTPFAITGSVGVEF